MTDVDVIVIGGGPIGLAAAIEARPAPADRVRWVAGEAARHWQAADRPTEAYRSSIEAALAGFGAELGGG